jgi:hypothetical protein
VAAGGEVAQAPLGQLRRGDRFERASVTTRQTPGSASSLRNGGEQFPEPCSRADRSIGDSAESSASGSSCGGSPSAAGPWSVSGHRSTSGASNTWRPVRHELVQRANAAANALMPLRSPQRARSTGRRRRRPACQTGRFLSSFACRRLKALKGFITSTCIQCSRFEPRNTGGAVCLRTPMIIGAKAASASSGFRRPGRASAHSTK